VAKFKVEFEFRGKEEVTRTEIRRALGLRNRWNTLFVQKFVHGDFIVTGSIVVVQYPRIRNLLLDKMNPFF